MKVQGPADSTQGPEVHAGSGGPRDRLRPYVAVTPATAPPGLGHLARALGADPADVRALLAEPRVRPAAGFRVCWHPPTRIARFVGVPVLLAVELALCAVGVLALAKGVGLIPGGDRPAMLVVGGAALFLGLGGALPFVFERLARSRFRPEIWVGAGGHGLRVGLLMTPRDATTVTARAVLRVIEERRAAVPFIRLTASRRLTAGAVLHFDSAILASDRRIAAGETVFLEGWLKFPAEAAASVSSVGRTVTWIVEVSLCPQGGTEWKDSTTITVVAEA